MDEQDIFERLFDVIGRRVHASPETSYVAGLMAGGVGRINDKVLEEAEEVCLAAVRGDLARLTGEICDLLLHTFVLAVHQGVRLDHIRSELERRFGVSGLTEKAARGGARPVSDGLHLEDHDQRPG